jgi:hypothetical protein
MNTSETAQSSGIQVTSRPINESREAFLVRHFGENYFWVEPAVSDWLKDFSDMSEEMRATSNWTWYELSNGGAFMDAGLVGKVHLRTPYFEGGVSMEAAAIIACLHTFNVLAFHGQGASFESHFRFLRRYAVRHAEAIAILDASES